MGIKYYKPTTPGRRKASVASFDEITATEPLKRLIRIRKKSAGRNNQGKITIRHRGGGAKQFYRVIDFLCDKYDIPAKVATIEYNPIVNARILLLQYADGEKRYSIAPQDIKVGDTVMSSKKRLDIKPGNRMPLEVIPQGTLVHNVELTPGNGGRMARSAGSAVKLMAIDGAYALLRMPSSELRMVPKECMATIGQVSNPDDMHIRIGKAGRMRHFGFRPSVRGKAMNPVDHPHGGGEGHNPIGMKHPKTLWGKPALGVKTRKQYKSSNRFIVQRRQRNK